MRPQSAARHRAAVQPKGLPEMRNDNDQRLTAQRKETRYARWRRNRPGWNGPDDRTRSRLLRRVSGSGIHESDSRTGLRGMGAWPGWRPRLAELVPRHRPARLAEGRNGLACWGRTMAVQWAIRRALWSGCHEGAGTGRAERPGRVLRRRPGRHQEADRGTPGSGPGPRSRLWPLRGKE
jgi:hypothetical protein